MTGQPEYLDIAMPDVAIAEFLVNMDQMKVGGLTSMQGTDGVPESGDEGVHRNGDEQRQCLMQVCSNVFCDK